MSETEPSRRARPGPWVILGITVGAVGLVVGGFFVQSWLSVSAAAQRHDQARAEVDEFWRANPAEEPLAPVTDPEPGTAVWLLHIPALWGQDAYPVVVGTQRDQLKGTLGWYPGTAQPGQVGNFAVAGHCRDDGGAFAGVIDLPVGAEIVVETRDARLTYELISSASELTVTAEDTWVLEPVPGQPDRAPSHALMTLTTCEDTFPTADRLVAFGVLTATEMK